MTIDVNQTGDTGGEAAQTKLIAEAGAEGLFVRQSSGLVREIGWRDTFAMSATLIAFILLFFNFAAGLGASQHGDFYLPLLVAAVVAIVTALTYSQLLSAMPRAGGDYVFASRVVGPVIGAAVGGALLLLMMLNGGSNTNILTTLGLPDFFQTAGSALHAHFLTQFSSTISTKTGYFVAGTIFLVVLGVIATRPLRQVTRVIFWSFAFAFVAYIVAIIELLVHSRADFVAAFNNASSRGAYTAIITNAHKLGLHTGVTIGGMVAVYAWAYLCFAGFTLGALAGGEVKRPSQTFKTAILAAAGAGLVVGLLSWAASRHAAGISFLQASPWLANNDPAAYATHSSVPASLGGLAFSSLYGDAVTKLVIVIGIVTAGIGILLTYILLTSRVIFALSFDRLLPTRLADVDRRTHAPLLAIILTVVGMVAYNAVGSYTSLLTIFRNAVLVSFAIFTLTSLWAMLLPYRRPELFAAAPKVVAGRVLGVPRVSVVAFMSVVGNGLGTYLVATKTAINGGYSAASIITLAVIAVAGLVLYVTSRAYLARRGLNLNMVMHELPPE